MTHLDTLAESHLAMLLLLIGQPLIQMMSYSVVAMNFAINQLLRICYFAWQVWNLHVVRLNQSNHLNRYPTQWMSK